MPLRQTHERERNWLKRMLAKEIPSLHFPYRRSRRDRGANDPIEHAGSGDQVAVATALSQSADHVLSFFKMLRTELAFYVRLPESA